MRIKVFTSRILTRPFPWLKPSRWSRMLLSSFPQKCPVPGPDLDEFEGAGWAALVMPAYLGESGALGPRWLRFFLEPRAHLPAVQAMVFLFDAANGSPLAVLEGTHLTRFRTGAATGAATQVLSLPDSRCLAVFGAGGQSFFQVKGVLAARKIGLIKVFDLLPEKADELIAGLRGDASCRGIELLRAGTPPQALEGADIVVTATTSTRPVFEGKLLREGMHIQRHRGLKPEMQEVMRRPSAGREFLWIPWKPCLEEAGT